MMSSGHVLGYVHSVWPVGVCVYVCVVVSSICIVGCGKVVVCGGGGTMILL